MRSILFVLAAAALSLVNAADPLVVNLPKNSVSNTPTLITWEGGVAPYNLRCVGITDSATNNKPITDSYPKLTGTSFVWNTSVPADTVAVAAVTDATGDIAYSGPFLVQVPVIQYT
ncbi:hypothetical protein BD413DRAFT_613368 [Trametes elegans]|nr:hypothetical protein BD413DRAFT_613368 [Trametes elegans]